MSRLSSATDFYDRLLQLRARQEMSTATGAGALSTCDAGDVSLEADDLARAPAGYCGAVDRESILRWDNQMEYMHVFSPLTQTFHPV